MSYLKAYEITLEIDGNSSVITLDDTMPSVRDWKSAIETAMLLVKMQKPSANVELLDCSEYVPDEFTGIDYAYPVPLVIQ
tara:strand:- start:237 stop:476 length:240 start_codon:yes stop_codon:yes gene_type:complete